MSPAKRLSRQRFRARMAKANATVTVYELFGVDMALGESQTWVRMSPTGPLERIR